MPWSRDLLAPAALLLAAALSGCSLLPGNKAKDGAEKAPAPRPVLQLDVQAPRALAALLNRHLSLARVNRQALGEPLNEGELERLVEQAPAQARELLETEGYFNATVTASIQPGTPPRVRVEVQPGPQTLVGDTQLQLQGPVVAAAERGEPEALAARRALREDWPLKAGAPFVASDWSRAKTASLAQQRAQGYVGAQWLSTQARVDVNTQRAALSGTMDSGPLHRVGPLRISGLKFHDEQTVRNIANVTPGRPATEEFLLDFQERLQKSGLFDRGTATLAPDAVDPEATPVNVQLTERKLQELTLGLGINANVGAEASVEHVHRRPFGRALIARNKFDIAQLRQQWEGDISTHTLPGLYRNLLGGAVQRTESDTDVVSSARLRVGRAQETGRISRLYFLETERSVTDRKAATSGPGKESSSSLALHYQGVWRKVDSALLPTRGHVWTGQLAAGQARSNPGGSGPFTRLYARLDAYRPFGGWFGQGRIEVGQVVAKGDVLVPETLRFRAGGDESVRGYKYRSLAPMQDGVVSSGKVLFTASAEMARPILSSVPDLLGAVFIDAGNAADRWQDLEPAFGYGVGVRYRTPVGPIKLDMAWGQEVKQLRLHLTVGVAF